MPAQPDLSLQLPRDTLYHALHQVRRGVPPVSDAPQDIERRDNAIIDQIASLLPANAEEIALAVQFVAANAAALDCQRLAQEHPSDTKHFLLCQERSDSMLRRAAAARSLLLRVQAAREKREKDPVASDKAALHQHVLIGLMAEALGRTPVAPMAEAPPPAIEPPPAEPEDKFAKLTEEERYAIMYPKRAAPIRAHGGLPPKLTFPPPEPELVHAIVASTSPILRELDQGGA